MVLFVYEILNINNNISEIIKDTIKTLTIVIDITLCHNTICYIKDKNNLNEYNEKFTANIH